MCRTAAAVAVSFGLLFLGAGFAAPRLELLQQIELPIDAPGTGLAAAGVSGSYAVVLSTPLPAPDPLVRQVHVYEQDLLTPDRWDHRITIRDAGMGAIGGFAQAADIDGDTLLVSAIDTNNSASVPNGRAFIFQRDMGGPNHWGLVAELLGSGAGRVGYGSDVALSGDTAVVSAQGSLYIFERDSGGSVTWAETRVIDGPSTLGPPLDLDGDSLIAGAPTETYVQESEFNPNLDNAGASYIFERNSGGPGQWGLVRHLRNPDPHWFVHDNFHRRFGAAVAISGENAVIGWPDYEGFFNTSVGLARFAVRRSNGAWSSARSQIRVPTEPDEFDQLGESVAVSRNRAVFGNSHGSWPLVVESDTSDPSPIAESTGAVRVYDRFPLDEDVEFEWRRTDRLISPTMQSDDFFGKTLAMDGDTLFVAAPGADTELAAEAGAVYVYTEKCAAGPFSDYTIDHNAQSLALDIVADENCSWRSYSDAPWISVSSGTAGTGNGSMLLAVDSNEGPASARRETLIRVGGRDIRIVQLAGAQIFADVSPSAFYFHAVNRFHELRLTSGCSAEPFRFCPDDPIALAACHFRDSRPTRNGRFRPPTAAIL